MFASVFSQALVQSTAQHRADIAERTEQEHSQGCSTYCLSAATSSWLGPMHQPLDVLEPASLLLLVLLQVVTWTLTYSRSPNEPVNPIPLITGVMVKFLNNDGFQMIANVSSHVTEELRSRVMPQA